MSVGIGHMALSVKTWYTSENLWEMWGVTSDQGHSGIGRLSSLYTTSVLDFQVSQFPLINVCSVVCDVVCSM